MFSSILQGLRGPALASLDWDVRDSVGVRLGLWYIPGSHSCCVRDIRETKVPQSSKACQTAMQIQI